MKILVTGGSGFLGSHVSDALMQAGHEVTIFDFNASQYLQDGQKEIVGDITDENAVNKAVEGCDVIYHLAALADINEAIDKPRETMFVNLMGTVNLLEAARKYKVKRFVFSSSIYVYSDQGSFYRTSKQACEHLIQDYHDRYGLEYTILRYGSLYGPRADASNSVFKMITSALGTGKIEYAGNGQEVREYIHIRDAALMSAEILEDEYKGSILHLTGRERITTGAMLEMLTEMLNGKVEVVLGNQNVKGHYMQTPYNYTPRIGRKMTRSTYIDLGLGLLDCIQSQDLSNPETHPSAVDSTDG
ncbi:MAG: NAD(P)-dependent oxidoreductase [Phycisphaeraceae bacterium]|nr:NAD(P)-dependent oxidoreductase [Phycisphaeraceae bacterium]